MIKVSELFYSLQGEGLYVGTPSVFLRVFGCNFTCSGFGMERGQKSQERFGVDPEAYSKYEDLPLVSTGCDSYASWDHRFKKFAPMMTEGQIVDRMQELLPEGKFGVNKHLILTGGEPMLLGWQKRYPRLLEEIFKRDMDLSHLTFETNGTQKLDEELRDALMSYDFLETTFSVSSKLSISGEDWAVAIKPNVIRSYHYSDNRCNIYFKWVVQDDQDLEDVRHAIEQYDMPEFPVYLMPVGGMEEMYGETHKRVAELALENGWRYSPRMQIDLWGNRWGS